VSLSACGVSAARRFRTPQEAISETFKEDIMKTQERKAKKTTGTKDKAAAGWPDRARALPLALFHTTAGPIIGRVDRPRAPGPFKFRLWAPAMLSMSLTPGADVASAVTAPCAVTFRPLMFVETYLDLAIETSLGCSPVPDALVAPYDAYFDKVAAGEYAFARTVARVEQAEQAAPRAPEGVEASAATADPDAADPDVAPDETDVS
jgi:hypothetical protein